MEDRSLKILIFDGSFKTTAFINRLAAGLAERHQVYIAGFNEKMALPIPRVNYIALGSNQSKKRFVSTAFYWTLKNKSLESMVRTFKSLLKGDKKSIQEVNLTTALEHIQPDLIHLQWTSVISNFEEVIKKQKIPVILSQRGFHTNVKPFVYPENMEYLQKWYPYFAGFHSVSKAITIKSDKIWSHKDKLDRVVYTGLLFEDWPFYKRYKKSEILQLLSVGRSHWIKGYDYGLQVCKLLKEKDIAFQYTIIGGAGDEELQFLVHDLGLQSQVTLQGKVSLEKVKEVMGEASLMLLPSLEEGLPNVAVEAMALGLPVVAFDVGGLPELIENGKEGWLVPVRDVEAMAEAVINFGRMSDEEVEVVRLAARKKVEGQHGQEQMVRGMEMLYKEIVLSCKNL